MEDEGIFNSQLPRSPIPDRSNPLTKSMFQKDVNSTEIRIGLAQVFSSRPSHTDSRSRPLQPLFQQMPPNLTAQKLSQKQLDW